ncbi:hypothetical protein Sros01_19760 [Streptomyces roseochromogenus]|nr:hypothetical protein Sros01_19760 [Streptomyces roseochromogenus]
MERVVVRATPSRVIARIAASVSWRRRSAEGIRAMGVLSVQVQVQVQVCGCGSGLRAGGTRRGRTAGRTRPSGPAGRQPP